MFFFVKFGKVLKIIFFRILNLVWLRGGWGFFCLYLIVFLLEMEEFLILFLEKRELSKNVIVFGVFVNFL